MARTLSPTLRELGFRRHAGVGLLTLALTCAAVVATFASIGSASERPPVSTQETDDRVIVCESGVISHGDVETASAVATRASSGELVPAGCREG